MFEIRLVQTNRIGGGCPTGQGITGMGRMNISSCLSCACMFVGGFLGCLLFPL
jgi:hypothetical protein